jgi:serine/threonine protein phosphatase PrpC
MKFGIFHHTALGEKFNGDAYFIKEYDQKVLLVAVDGLGHGLHAYEAAQTAIHHIKNNYHKPLEDLIWGCHKKMVKTRGAVIGLVRIDFETRLMEWVGVGNVVLQIIRGHKSIRPISINGIVGINMRKLKKDTLEYTPGDLFLLFTDGIADKREILKFIQISSSGPQALANDIGSIYFKRHDDATMIVAQ